MKVYRVAALGALACAGGIALAACSGGISTVAQTPASSPASSPSAAASGTTITSSDGNTTSVGTSATSAATSTASAGASISGGPAASTASTITVGGGIGTFPIPAGASVIANSVSNGNPEFSFTGVTASEVTTFYTASLPSYGYTITQNDEASGTSATGTTIKFTGHGYNGDIGGLSGTGSVDGVSLGSTTSGGVTGITFTPA